MPTVLTHAAAAAALTPAFPRSAVPRRLILLASACAMAPDIDVIGFRFGIHYGDLLGHRGLSHSIVFAAALSVVALLAALPSVVGTAHRLILWVYFFAATASHGVLDAFTDGGLGVALLSPFDATRYFFPFRPIEVSPIGARFFSARGVSVLQSEFVWVWLPFIVFAVVAFAVRRAFSSHEQV
jgi:inner membrane protein